MGILIGSDFPNYVYSDLHNMYKTAPLALVTDVFPIVTQSLLLLF